MEADSLYVEMIARQDSIRHCVESMAGDMYRQIVDFPDGRWFCFYRTHRGLAGRESGNQGQHMHFISSSYGIDRDKLVDGFKKGVCPSNGFHVQMSGYWEEDH